METPSSLLTDVIHATTVIPVFTGMTVVGTGMMTVYTGMIGIRPFAKP